MTAAEKERCGISKYAPVKAVIKISEDGKTLETYPSVAEAAKRNNLKPAAICNAIKRNGKAGGIRFSYLTKPESRVIIMPKRKNKPTFQQTHLPYGGVYSEQKGEKKNENKRI